MSVNVNIRGLNSRIIKACVVYLNTVFATIFFHAVATYFLTDEPNIALT